MRCRIFRTVALLSLLPAAQLAAQACPPNPPPSTCGCDFDVLFANGFDPPAATITLPPDATALAVKWTEPADGATVGDNVIQARGTFSGPSNVGITLNNHFVAIAGNTFASPSIPLKSGSNTLTLVTTTTAGSPQTVTRTVTFNPALAPEAVLRSDASSGYAPLSTRFRVALKAGSTRTIERIDLDFDDSGSIDFSTTDPAAVLKTSYTNPGARRVRAVITLRDAMNVQSTVTSTLSIVVLSQPRERLVLCKVFNDMRQRLIANDIPGALLRVSTDFRPTMQATWTGIGAALPTAANRIGFVLDGDLNLRQAALRLARPDTTDPTIWDIFPLTMSRADDGVWRVEEM